MRFDLESEEVELPELLSVSFLGSTVAFLAGSGFDGRTLPLLSVLVRGCSDLVFGRTCSVLLSGRTVSVLVFGLVCSVLLPGLCGLTTGAGLSGCTRGFEFGVTASLSVCVLLMVPRPEVLVSRLSLFLLMVPPALVSLLSLSE